MRTVGGTPSFGITTEKRGAPAGWRASHLRNVTSRGRSHERNVMPRSIQVDREEFARLWDKGVPSYRIAEHFDIHSNTVTRIVSEMKLPSRARQVDVPKLFRLWTQGVAREVICREFNISGSHLSVLKTRYKLPDRPKRPASLAPDPTQDEIAERAKECRDRHMALRRAENVLTTNNKVSKWRAGICNPR